MVAAVLTTCMYVHPVWLIAGIELFRLRVPRIPTPQHKTERPSTKPELASTKPCTHTKNQSNFSFDNNGLI